MAKEINRVDNEFFEGTDFGGMDIVLSGDPVGGGATYSVYVAESSDGRRYAVRLPKDINPYITETTKLTKTQSSRIMREEEVWKELSDACPDKIVQLIGTSKIRDVPAQIMEYADRRYTEVESSLSIGERLDVVIRVLECLASIHEVGIVHNDIKPDNVLQIGDVWKICDFDISFYDGDRAPERGGTFEYDSPEKLSDGDVTVKSDIWAAGVLLYHSLTMRLPFDGGEQEYKENILAGNFNRGVVSQKYIPVLERVFSLDKLGRAETLEVAKGLAKEEAVKAGADPDTIEIVEVEDVPLAYLPGNATRVRVKAVGDLRI